MKNASILAGSSDSHCAEPRAVIRTLAWTVLPLRIVMVFTFLLLLVAEFISFPGEFLWENRQLGEPPDWILLIMVQVGLVCMQVVIICTWKLLTMVRKDTVFTVASLKWVNTIIGSIGVAWALLFTLVVFATGADDPGPMILAMLIFLPATAIALLIVVMRALLIQATNLKRDMEGVI